MMTLNISMHINITCQTLLPFPISLHNTEGVKQTVFLQQSNGDPLGERDKQTNYLLDLCIMFAELIYLRRISRPAINLLISTYAYLLGSIYLNLPKRSAYVN